MRKSKRVQKLPTTVGVRFPCGNVSKVYTYRIAASTELHLGQEVVVDTDDGPKIVFVVRVDKSANVPSGYTLLGLKKIRGVVKSI